MRAIVLTCDKYRALTDHMIFKYNELWPDHPFTFRIPYQELPHAETAKREYIKSPMEIKATVLKLLEDLHDEEWIFWCIDDKYPILLKLPRIRAITRWISNKRVTDISGILFCRCRRVRRPEYLSREEICDDEGNVYLGRKGYEQIWIPQFLRVKVIRYLFEQFPDRFSAATEMDLFKSQVRLPESHRLFVSQVNRAIFGESTSHGMLTENCYQSITENKLPLPEWFTGTNGKVITMGKLKKKSPTFLGV